MERFLILCWAIKGIKKSVQFGNGHALLLIASKSAKSSNVPELGGCEAYMQAEPQGFATGHRMGWNGWLNSNCRLGDEVPGFAASSYSCSHPSAYGIA